MDCITLVRKLKNHTPPIGVFFETDNLFTLSEDSELKLSMLATFAQEESIKKSESMNWSLKERFKNKKLLTPELYGYRRPKLLIRKSFFNCDNFSEDLLKEITKKIKENLELKFRDYSFTIDEKKNDIYINTNRLMTSNTDARTLADFIDNVVMLYIAESKK